MVSWCFEPSQPQRITSGLNTNFTLSPSYSFHKSSHHLFFEPIYTPRAISTGTRILHSDPLHSAGDQHGNPHPAQRPTPLRGRSAREPAPCTATHSTPQASHSQHRRNRERSREKKKKPRQTVRVRQKDKGRQKEKNKKKKRLPPNTFGTQHTSYTFQKKLNSSFCGLNENSFIVHWDGEMGEVTGRTECPSNSPLRWKGEATDKGS